MKRIIWFLFLAACATGLALLMGDSRASAVLFWPPYRISLSFNLLVFLLLAFFVLLYFALRTLQAFLSMPSRAQTWRSQYHERAMYQQLLDAHMQLWAGRYSRAAKSAALALDHAHKREAETPVSSALEMMAAHLLAVMDGVPVGSARLLTEGAVGKIGRVCVLQSARGKGIGADLIRAAVARFRGVPGIAKVKLGAQVHALGFYAGLGFAPVGEEYLDAGIVHRDMVLTF